MSKYKPADLVGIFKKHALKLVMAASGPLITNENIMEGGSECISVLEKDEKLHPLDAIMATMWIVNNQYNTLQLIQQTGNIPEKIDNELAKNVRRIFVILKSSPSDFPSIHPHEFFKKYLQAFEQKLGSDVFRTFQRQLKPKKGLFACAGGCSGTDKNTEPIMKCFRTMISPNFENNFEFFLKLTTGFHILGTFMSAYEKGIDNDTNMKEGRTRLDAIIEEVAKCKLETPDSDYIRTSSDVIDGLMK